MKSLRMRSLLVAVLAATTGFPAAGQTPAPSGEILVFGAASLTESLQELGKQFEASTGTKVAFSFGGSNDLARQIQAGAPADVFYSADTAKMDALEKAGLVRAADTREFLSNVLVVVVPSSSTLKITSAKDLAALPKLALADPAAVPAGVYARTWLTRKASGTPSRRESFRPSTFARLWRRWPAATSRRESSTAPTPRSRKTLRSPTQ